MYCFVKQEELFRTGVLFDEMVLDCTTLNSLKVITTPSLNRLRPDEIGRDTPFYLRIGADEDRKVHLFLFMVWRWKRLTETMDSTPVMTFREYFKSSPRVIVIYWLWINILTSYEGGTGVCNGSVMISDEFFCVKLPCLVRSIGLSV